MALDFSPPSTTSSTSNGVIPGTPGGSPSLNFAPPVAKTKQPTFAQGIGGMFSEAGKLAASPFIAAYKGLTSPTPPSQPLQPVSNYFKGEMAPKITGDISAAFDKTKTDFESALSQKSGPLLAQSGLDAINTIFQPINTGMTALAQSGGVTGRIGKALNGFFGQVGHLGGDALNQVWQSLPISQQTKDAYAPQVRQLGELGGQVLLGKIGADTLSTIKSHTSAILDGVKNDPTVLEATKTIPQEATYTPPSETPTGEPIAGSKIDFTPPTGKGIAAPEIQPQVRVGTTEIPALTKETIPVEQGTPASQSVTDAESLPIKKTRSVPGSLKPIDGTGEIKARGLAQGIEAKAIEKGLVDTFGDVPQYQTINLRDQANRVSELINKDPERAKSVAMGTRQAPKGIIPEMVLKGIEDKALSEGDVGTLRELSTQSLLTGEATTMGQRLRALAERDPNSPVGAIKAVQDARTAELKNKGIEVQKEVSKIQQEIRSQISKRSASRQSWEDFIKSIACNY